MLDRAHRLTHPRDFTRVARRGRRKAGKFVVCHSLLVSQEDNSPVSVPSDRGTRFGIVSSKAVGNAPTRNRVRRRLREIARELMTEPVGDVVIRALPGSADASWDQLRTEVRTLLGVTAP
ncbi:ribonuclease P protein component [Alpinimonas psychrophila]|uniref:Ribonuclease P protein component n=1 Tax=Alpinimonas psychrophila TaxID=748908 RepID=A0A7W3JU71_9MICO|nr:ribonuclease P protein component [Alpinimonas psychrophila]